ncbi:MAG: ABC transporter permease [Desulfuromonadaceae bacterium]|nr:ABC transporter permease [Desulfuromonadaceae bacterium]
MNMKRVVVVAHKEWREIIRDRVFFSLSFIVPVVMMLLLGYGLSLDVENIPFAVVDYDRSALSRDYTYRFIGSRYFAFKGYVSDERALARLLTENRVRAAIIIPEKFQERLLNDRPVRVQTLIDGTFPSRTMITKGYVIAINSAASQELLAGYLSRKGGMPLKEARQVLQPVSLEVRFLYNQSVKSIWSIAPKLIMVILMVSPPFLTALGVVREKESGSIYNIYASTVSRGEFLFGKVTPYIAISSFNSLVLWALATQLFGAPFKGNFLFYLTATFLYLICTTGIGLLVSVLVRTQIAAMMVTAIVTLVPGVLYSGVLIPITSLTKTAQMVAHCLPAMYYTNIVVGCFLKGVGLRVLWLDTLVLVLYATALFTLGYSLFHKRPSS